MNMAALMILKGMQVHDGTDLGVNGYHSVRMDALKSNLFFGKGWIDVDRANIANYPF